MKHLQEVADLLRKQLGEIEAKIAQGVPKTDAVPIDDLHKKVADMHSSKKWKTFVNNGVVYNILQILEECYDPLIDNINEDDPSINASEIIGDFNSRKWQEFQLLVINKLLSPDSMDEDFSDTANGCDEIVWDAALDVIRELA